MRNLATRPDAIAYGLAGLAVLGIVVLAALGQPVPEVLGLIATGAIGGGAGAALQGRSSAPAPVPLEAGGSTTIDGAIAAARLWVAPDAELGAGWIAGGAPGHPEAGPTTEQTPIRPEPVGD
jgi:hypothetical protein